MFTNSDPFLTNLTKKEPVNFNFLWCHIYADSFLLFTFLIRMILLQWYAIFIFDFFPTEKKQN